MKTQQVKKIQIHPAVSLRMGLDNNKMRLSEWKLNELGFSVGDLVLLNGHKGMIVLELARAFQEDLEEQSEESIFVSSSVFSRIKDWNAYVKPYAFLLGCDPEFLLIMKTRCGDKVIPANKVLKEYSDYGLGEIRPKPAATVPGLLGNIEKELKSAHKIVSSIKSLKFYGTSFMSNMCAGFHIHFNMPQELLCFVGANPEHMIKSIVSILDSSVGLVSRIDPDSDRRMNYNLGYGCLGDFKLSMKTLEYRVPGAYWLRSRETCSLILSYSYQIFRRILIEMRRRSKNWKLPVAEMKLRESFDLPTKEQTEQLYKQKPNKEMVLKLLGTAYRLEDNPDIITNWRLG